MRRWTFHEAVNFIRARIVHWRSSILNFYALYQSEPWGTWGIPRSEVGGPSIFLAASFRPLPQRCPAGQGEASCFRSPGALWGREAKVVRRPMGIRGGVESEVLNRGAEARTGPGVDKSGPGDVPVSGGSWAPRSLPRAGLRPWSEGSLFPVS